MSASETLFHIDGPHLSEIADELAQLIERQFGVSPKRVRSESTGSSDSDTERTDPVAVASLVLAVPSAIVATLTLAERLELKKKVDGLISWAKERVRERLEVRIVVSRRGRSVPLDSAEPGEIIDLLAPSGEEPEPETEDKP